MKEETWRPVRSHPDKYRVSDKGNVENALTGRRMKQWWNGKPPYLKVRLADTLYAVHWLVLEAFKGSRPPGSKGLHKDDDKSNNSAENLYWGTSSNNMADRSRNGWGVERPWQRKKYCIRNHELTPENRYPKTGDCKLCARERARKNKKKENA